MSLFSRKNVLALISAFVVVGFAGVTAPRADADTFVYYDFNDTTTTATLTTPSVGSSRSTMTTNFSSLTNFGGTTINAFNSAPAGQALALVNQTNNGNYLQFTANTTNYKNIMVSYATQKTATGFNSVQFQYSLNGTSFTNFGAAYDPATAFALKTFDLSSITGLNNDSAAAFRLVFNGASSASGNNRIDNLQIIGATPEVSTSVAMLVGGLGLGVLLMSKRRKGVLSV